uniref:Clarin-3 n=1 Tax=Steinernema glaseri TaxID=37863 RepID=A0A1I7Z847_9BILA
MSSESRVGQTLILVFSLALLLVGIGLNVAGLLSPSWQVVDIKEFRAEHHHGLWLDCTRAELRMVETGVHTYKDESRPLHCTYKFDMSAAEEIDRTLADIDINSAAGEAEHHQFFGWHKVVLGFMFLSMSMALLALVFGICSPYYGACAVVYDILVFLALSNAVIADGTFFFASHRVDNRFVQGLVGTYEQKIVDNRFVQGLVGTYEQKIGNGFYLHGVGTILLLFSFIVSTVAAYQLLRKTVSSRDELPLRELAPLYGSHMRETAH